MKKFLAVILSLTLVFLSLTACASKSYVDLDQLNKEYQSDDSEQTNSENNDKVVGDKYTIPEEENPYFNSEYGFYALEQTGDMLIEITGYDLTGDTPYVYFESPIGDGPSMKSFKNGFEYHYSLPELTKSASVRTFYESDISSGKIGDPYAIIDNDNIYYGSDSDTIVDRMFFEEHDLVIIKFDGGLIKPVGSDGLLDCYVPSSAIDWERGVKAEITGDYNDPMFNYDTRFILYLK